MNFLVDRGDFVDSLIEFLEIDFDGFVGVVLVGAEENAVGAYQLTAVNTEEFEYLAMGLAEVGFGQIVDRGGLADGLADWLTFGALLKAAREFAHVSGRMAILFIFGCNYDGSCATTLLSDEVDEMHILWQVLVVPVYGALDTSINGNTHLSTGQTNGRSFFTASARHCSHTECPQAGRTRG